MVVDAFDMRDAVQIGVELPDQFIGRHAYQKGSRTGVDPWVFFRLHGQVEDHIKSPGLGRCGNLSLERAVRQNGKCQNGIQFDEFLRDRLVVTEIVDNNGNAG